MSSRKLPVGDDESLTLSSILSESRQRQILALLLEQRGPLTDRDLAVQLSVRESENRPSDVAEEDLQQVLVALYHEYLPELQTIGWIERSPEGIVLTEQFPAEKIESSLPPLEGPEQEWEILTTLLARPRRRHIVLILARQEHPLTLEDLTVKLRAYEQISLSIDGGASLSGALHHVDLPWLDEVGLIEYDPEEKTITREHDLTSIVDRIADMRVGGSDNNSEF